jgi:4-amino-4-deoxy-L-arabinose transferase-like glycosyltransferase
MSSNTGKSDFDLHGAINVGRVNQDAGFNKCPAWLLFIWSLTLSAGVLFYRLGELSIDCWDEARLANNALEMANSGLSLVTTYDGSPDHWNTKPPLVIWLMCLAMEFFGASELSVRLPSAIAAMATLIMVFAFAAYYLKRPLIGLFAVLILLCIRAYIHLHGARSGNYDPVLTLWTTGYLLSGYLYLTDDKHRALWLSLCMSGMLLAFFTKTAQGLIFAPALIIYALYKRQYFVLKSPLVYCYGLLVLAAGVAYYLLRDRIDPGYLDSAISNDLLGRFATVIENNAGGPFYYIKPAWMILALGIIGFQFIRRNHSELRDFSIFLGMMFLFYLLIISAASTKLPWYLIPLSPLASLLIAIALYQLMEDKLFKITLPVSRWGLIVFPAAILISLLVFAFNVREIEKQEANSKNLLADQYNYFLRSAFIQSKQIPKFAVLHPGYYEGNFYVAPALFYINTLRKKGLEIAILQADAAIPEDYRYLLLCGEKIKNRIEVQFELQAVGVDRQCGMYAIVRDKDAIKRDRERPIVHAPEIG